MASESGASTAQKMRVWAYQKGPGRYYRPAYRNIATAIGIEEGAVLDVGCGPGWTSIFMAAGKPHLDAVGIDTCETMLEYANANRGPSLNVTFRHMDAAEIIYPDGTFHVACAVQSAHRGPKRMKFWLKFIACFAQVDSSSLRVILSKRTSPKDGSTSADLATGLIGEAELATFWYG